LISTYKEDFADIELVVPVPIHRVKRNIRNYNPPQILAENIAKSISAKIISDVLIKTKWTKPQTSLTQAQRKQNLSGSVNINKKYNIKGKIILLVDDVRTTGVTSNTCSAILKNAGAKSVKLLTIGTT